MAGYDPSHWFWVIGGDESRWWSSAAAAYVAPDQAWLDAGNSPTRIVGEADLSDVLSTYGLTGPLPVLGDLQPKQFAAVLDISGHTAALDAWVDALPSPEKYIARASLDRSLSFQRNNELVLAAQQALGISDADLDALWQQAAAL